MPLVMVAMEIVKKCFGNWDCSGSCHDYAKMLLHDICKDIEEILRKYEWFINNK